jgi:hypothetical protein
MPSTYDKIATQTLVSTSNNVVFTSIPSTYTDLILVVSGKLNTTNYVDLNFNNDFGSNYSYTQITGNGSTATSSRNSNQGFAYSGQVGSTNFDTVIFQINNYSNTTTNKTVISRINNVALEVGAWVALWRNTVAINRIDANSGNGSATWQIGSTFTLYGIKAA